ncbi:pre-peptidase C-terminal domain-containing protein [Leptothermofonsia sichuanensis E412]|uniref:pre-peptidase C-terminal domain-containing protein n=1 Tax=Leptothermofonsia sichuanensis TaxID=2917832 RepID=UPI001CA79B7D|nr:pre-peptidase C-terminal domain-containing protein [Leptothermofonsia sichuanensis]QZZ22803.1 pre-peptidase C-terminal domain-containing protein [Leptothermofonsia sichuanensis E412]
MEPFAQSTQTMLENPVTSGTIALSERSLPSLLANPLDAGSPSISSAASQSSLSGVASPPPLDGSLIQIQPLAQTLGILYGRSSLTGSLNAGNPYDVYRFELPALSSPAGFNLQGTGSLTLTSEALIVLVEDRNNNGRVDPGEVFEGSSTRPVQLPYRSGTTYYAIAYSPGGDLNYTLTLEADFAGNMLSTAVELGTLYARQSFQDFIGGTDQEDYYRFSIDEPGNLTLRLEGLTADANLQLVQDRNNNGFIEDNEILQVSANPGAAAEIITRQITPGIYFVRVLADSDQGTNYTLTLDLAQAGNSLSDARLLRFFDDTQSFFGFLDSTAPEDYYQFEVFTDSNLSLVLNGRSDRVTAQLIQDLNGNGTVEADEILATSVNQTGTLVDTLSRPLAAGIYFVRVLAPTPNASTNYQIDLSVTRQDQAGNDLASAQEIGVSAIPSPFTGWVDSTDANDYYRFSLLNASTVNLTLDSLSADANLQLIQDLNQDGIVDSNEILRTSANPGLAPESISQFLEPGDYFIRVYVGSGSTNYRLTVAALPVLDQAGNTLNDARLIALNSTASSFTDRVGNGDEDYYRFTIAANGTTFNLLLDDLQADAIAELIQDLNNDGIVDANEVLQTAVSINPTTKTLNRELDSGTYFVRIAAATPVSTSYRLSVSLDRAGNTPDLARPIPASDTPLFFSDWVGPADPIDYYQISLSRPSDLSLSLSGLSADVRFRLLDSSGALIRDSILNPDGTRSLNQTQLTGTGWIEVSSLRGSTSYTLQVAAPPVDNAGNSLASALDLGSLRGSQNFNDFVGNIDPRDYYRFSLNTPGTLTAQLTGLNADASLFLIQDRNNNGQVDGDDIIQFDTSPGAIAKSLTQVLETGTYFILVQQGTTNANTDYSLTLTVDQAGNTLEAARPIAVDTANRSFSDFISETGTDTSDYYRFSLDSNQTLSLALTTFNQRAAVQLIQDRNGNGIVDPDEILLTQETTGTAPISFSQPLEAGTYWLRVLPTTGDANYTLTVSTGPIDWFGLNLRDLDVIELARTAFTNGEIDHNETLTILRSTQDGGIVTRTELADLRLLVGNGQSLGMPDHVRILADRVVNGSVANQFFQGEPLGNLADSGDSATRMELLIRKWFLGQDRPLAQSSDGQITYTYRLASGSLFQNGIRYTDIRQGDLANAYLLAALAATALRSPDVIQTMFIDNGDDTYTVRFYNNGVADYVTVDRYLPVTAVGTFAYAGFDTFYNVSTNELWVALAEKAYAQMNELGWLGQDNTNSYQGIASGLETIAVQQITNRATTERLPLNLAALGSAFNAGELVFVKSNPVTVAPNIVPDQEYVVVDYDSTTQFVTLFNPWGTGDRRLEGSSRPGIVTLSESELIASFAFLSFTRDPSAVPLL